LQKSLPGSWQSNSLAPECLWFLDRCPLSHHHYYFSSRAAPLNCRLVLEHTLAWMSIGAILNNERFMLKKISIM
jgi:hypothetical protein